MILFVPQKWLLYSNVIYNFFIYLFLFYCYHLIFYFASELKLMIKDSYKRFRSFSITIFSHCFVAFFEFPSFKELYVFIYIWNISLSRHETTFLFNIKLRNILCHPHCFFPPRISAALRCHFVSPSICQPVNAIITDMCPCTRRADMHMRRRLSCTVRNSYSHTSVYVDVCVILIAVITVFNIFQQLACLLCMSYIQMCVCACEKRNKYTNVYIYTAIQLYCYIVP